MKNMLSTVDNLLETAAKKNRLTDFGELYLDYFGLRHKHGMHTYSLEAFGLSPAGMKKRYSQYYDEYGSLL